jgi:hypothetical protein
MQREKCFAVYLQLYNYLRKPVAAPSFPVHSSSENFQLFWLTASQVNNTSRFPLFTRNGLARKTLLFYLFL